MGIEIYNEIPPEVVDYFHFKTSLKEPHATPANNLVYFRSGLAPYQSGIAPLVDERATKLIPNYYDYSEIDDSGILLPPFIGNTDTVERFHEQRDKSPSIVMAPHPSIATPYLIARYLNQPFTDDVARRIYMVAGPRPMLLDYTLGDEEPQTETISPYAFGIALGQLMLTGTNTESTDDAPEAVTEWLVQQNGQFKENLAEILEPNEQGDNNVVIICHSGRIGKHTDGSIMEYYPRSYRFAADIADQVVFWPFGVFDRLLVDPKKPQSMVHIHPDATATRVKTGKDAENTLFTLHKRAVELANSPLGDMRMQSRIAAKGGYFGKAVGQRIGAGFREVNPFGKD